VKGEDFKVAHEMGGQKTSQIPRVRRDELFEAPNIPRFLKYSSHGKRDQRGGKRIGQWGRRGGRGKKTVGGGGFHLKIQKTNLYPHASPGGHRNRMYEKVLRRREGGDRKREACYG